jgi:dephospho-CoA kinase
METAGEAIAIADIPLLFETGREGDFDVVITTACHPDVQLRRLMTRDALTEAEARQRLAAQLPTEEKVRRADYVVWTDGAFEDTNRQVGEVLDRLGRKGEGG